MRQNMYEVSGASIAQRITLAVLVGLWLTVAWWLLVGHGLDTLSAWLGWVWKSGDPVRRACLVCAFSIYYIRMLFTGFVFLKRGIGWGEVFTIAPWVLFIFLFIGIYGGTNPNALGAAGAVGLVLFAAGSWLNTHAELARHTWKAQPENRGHLYTQGFFRFTRHPNYLGDLLSFSGLGLISGRFVTAIVPVLMLAGFVFGSIPMLDSYLQKKYGAEFGAYAGKTRKLIPFVY